MRHVCDALRCSSVVIPSLKSAAEPGRELGIATLDQVPCFQRDPSAHHRLAVVSDSPNMGGEQIRMLTTRLGDVQRQRQLKTLLITSSIKDEGKSVLSANIAISLATMQKRVLLLDGDFHQSSLADLLGAGEPSGLEGWWRTDRPVVNYLTKMRTLPLWFLAAGRPFPQTPEMLQSLRLSTLLNQLAATFDWFIIDSPPLAPLPDAPVWASLADATLLVVRLKRTPTKVLTKMLDSMDRRKLLGLVVNECKDRPLSYYAQYYKNMSLKKETPRPPSARTTRELSASRKPRSDK